MTIERYDDRFIREPIIVDTLEVALRLVTDILDAEKDGEYVVMLSKEDEAYRIDWRFCGEYSSIAFETSDVIEDYYRRETDDD